MSRSAPGGGGPLPRKLRFYDPRHTHATLLRKAGVDLGAVQRSLGHSSPEITAALYDHSDVQDYREEVERALTFAEPPRVSAAVMQSAGTGKTKAAAHPVSRASLRPSESRGDWI